jgi:hypothetical protein
MPMVQDPSYIKSLTECNAGWTQRLFGVDTTIEVRNITTSVSNGFYRAMFDEKCAVIFSRTCYIFELRCSISSKWQFLSGISIAFSDGSFQYNNKVL